MADAPESMFTMVQNAIKDQLNPTEEAPEGTVAETETPVADPVVTEPTEPVDAKSETPPEPAAEGTEELPDSYFGVDRSGLDDESWKAVIAGFSERDKHIQALLREKAATAADPTPEPVATPVETPAEPGLVTDQAILEALGLNPQEDPDDERTAKVAVPLARMVLDLKNQVEGVDARAQAAETDTLWRTSLKSMEDAYGSLPADINHTDVMKAAAIGGIADPVDAYWRVMGPARSSILAEVTRRKGEAEARLKEGQAALKPKGSVKTETPIIESKDTSDAIKQAFRMLNKDKEWATTEYGEE